ncbi:MAG: hypothetical protein DRJ42_26380 [Deltaproteobacteria bacterium]|nr:MAG: hypothetical protein DRJ42_26380 [Deltaproteobacteria bacterium]
MVEVTSDLMPGSELSLIETTLLRGDEVVSAASHTVLPAEPLTTGIRVAELSAARGPYTVRLEAKGPDGSVILEQSREVVIEGRLGLRIRFDGECVGVACPSGDDPITYTACSRGRCVVPACVDQPASCGTDAGPDSGVEDSGTAPDAADTGTAPDAADTGTAPDGGPGCSPDTCVIGEFCTAAGVCEAVPICPTTCAGPCVRGRCLDVSGGEYCGPGAAGFLVRTGPVPNCSSTVAPPAMLDVPGRGAAQLVGPYPVTTTIAASLTPDSLRGFFHTRSSGDEEWSFAWSDAARAVRVGKLRAFHEGTPPETCVLPSTNDFADDRCAGVPTPLLGLEAQVFDVETVGATAYAALGGASRVELYAQQPSGCFSQTFSGGSASNVTEIAVFGETAPWVGYWNNEAFPAFVLLNSGGDSSTLAPDSTVLFQTPLVSAGGFLFFGTKNSGEADPSPWANSAWHAGWPFERVELLNIATTRVAGDSVRGGSALSAWANLEDSRVEYNSLVSCGMVTCVSAGTSGAPLSATIAGLPLDIAAEETGGALSLFTDYDRAGSLILKVQHLAAAASSTGEPVTLLRGVDVGGNIVDVFDLVVTTNRETEASITWEIVYGVILEVERDGVDTTELWAGSIRFCGP